MNSTAFSTINTSFKNNHTTHQSRIGLMTPSSTQGIIDYTDFRTAVQSSRVSDRYQNNIEQSQPQIEVNQKIFNPLLTSSSFIYSDRDYHYRCGFMQDVSIKSNQQNCQLSQSSTRKIKRPEKQRGKMST
eukprot:403360961